MSWWRGLNSEVRLDVPLAPDTWYGVGGAARYGLAPWDVNELLEALRLIRECGVPWRVLGCGANVLVRDQGFDGLVLRLHQPAFKAATWNAEGVRVGGGVDVMRLVHAACCRGLAGLEGLAGIPASVGGAVRMNAGGKWGAVADSLTEVVLARPDGSLSRLSKEECGFGYRRSRLGEGIVVEAAFRLRPEAPAMVLARYHDHWRCKRETQPWGERNAGCVFRNPPGLAAGALIEQAGLKGTRRGGAFVSPRHANFIICDSGACGTDVLHLIDHVRERISHTFGVEMELEIDVW